MLGYVLTKFESISFIISKVMIFLVSRVVLSLMCVTTYVEESHSFDRRISQLFWPMQETISLRLDCVGCIWSARKRKHCLRLSKRSAAKRAPFQRFFCYFVFRGLGGLGAGGWGQRRSRLGAMSAVGVCVDNFVLYGSRPLAVRWRTDCYTCRLALVPHGLLVRRK